VVLHYRVIITLHGLHPLVLEQEHWAPKLYSPTPFIGTLCSYIGVSPTSHEHLLEVKPFITLPTFNIVKVVVPCCYCYGYLLHQRYTYMTWGMAYLLVTILGPPPRHLYSPPLMDGLLVSLVIMGKDIDLPSIYLYHTVVKGIDFTAYFLEPKLIM